MNRAIMTTKFSVYLLFLIFLIFLLPDLATADIIPSRDIDPPYPVGLPDPWDITPEDLIIGKTITGSIEINGGSGIVDANGYIGFDPGGSGTVTVTGFGSHWVNVLPSGGDLYVGYEGEGEMYILDGGNVLNE